MSDFELETNSDGRAFNGAKLITLIGGQLLVIRRDNRLDIPFPGRLDFPGGGREGSESAMDCALREAREEVGLNLRPRDLVWRNAHVRPNWLSWFFACDLPAELEKRIVFGNEGQGWALIEPRSYLARDDAIDHFKQQLNAFLVAKKP